MTQQEFTRFVRSALPSPLPDPLDEEAVMADIPRLWREGYNPCLAVAFLHTFQEVDPSRGEEEALADRERIEAVHRTAGNPRRG